MNKPERIRELFGEGNGIFKMVPNWVPRAFNRPGKRLRLHPDDYYALGIDRGAITERWFSSITPVSTANAPKDEGMSYVNDSNDLQKKVLFKDIVDELGEDLIGEKLMAEYGTWPMYSKFYDYQYPLFHHVHHGEEAAKRAGVLPKHEHYFFPIQYNNHLGAMPISFFGFDPSVSKEDVKNRLRCFETTDGRITELSRAFRLELGTGWYTPAGVVHAPGSLLTYEPQWNSDAMAIWENIVSGEPFGYDWLSMYVPEGKERDLDYIFNIADWELNSCTNYRERFFHAPVSEQTGEGFHQNWIAYGNPYIAAKELTIEPLQTVTIKDNAAYGCIVVQGIGKIGKFNCESPTLIRFGQLTSDEYFISCKASSEGVTIKNLSSYEPLVILKHFGPDCKMPQAKKY